MKRHIRRSRSSRLRDGPHDVGRRRRGTRGRSDTTGDRLSPHHHQRHVEHPCVYGLDDHRPRDARSARRRTGGTGLLGERAQARRRRSVRDRDPRGDAHVTHETASTRTCTRRCKVKEHPDIVFRLLRLEPRSGAPGALRGIGVLQIAGVEREVALDVTTERKDSTLNVQGRVQLLMTDFGIKPPTAMLGMLKTDPKVTVTFETVLAIPRT